MWCCAYIACFATAIVYKNKSLAYLLLLLFCLPAVANFYTVMSQDVVTVAVVLDMHACVGRNQHLPFTLLAIPTETSACMFSGYTCSSNIQNHATMVCYVYEASAITCYIVYGACG